MKMTFENKLTLSLCVFLAIFSAGVIFFEQYQAKKYKTEAMEERLDSYVEIAYKYLKKQENFSVNSNTLLSILPENLRLTVIDSEGKVLNDNQLDDFSGLDNHLERPEIVAASKNGIGSDIRLSASMQMQYLYYAKKRGNLYVRVALPYDIQVQHFLKPNNAFLYYLILLFLVGILFIHYIASRFGKTVKQLRDYSSAINNNLPIKIPNFSNDEIGEIGEQIAKDYKRLKESEIKFALQHEKLLMHIQSLAEGVCFFTPDKKVAFHNGFFLQYLTTLSDRTFAEPSDVLNETFFADIETFLKDPQDTYFETQINKNGKCFLVRVNIFDDQSFEIVLTDKTKLEKNRQLKQEMTGNIAHELRTPVTAIRGYLETILETEMNNEKKHEFIYKSYEQVIALSEMIRDMSLLAKLNGAPNSLQLTQINIPTLINKIESDLKQILQAKDIILQSDLPQDTTVVGNENLIYSVFRNLMDNVINHAGESITIVIQKYNQDKQFAYFSFSDNGIGIENENHLIRLFERFYRVCEGRTRENGGSGLGLAIVKNAITFHGGTITVRNQKNGGLEFLFSLLV